MNVTVENLGACKKLLRVELDAAEVDKAFVEITRDFQKAAALPGFRPGKAPRGMVERRYSAEIEQEVKKKLIPDAYRKALKEQEIDPIGYPDIEEVQFGRGQVLQFAATVETAPDFELPEYKGLPIQRETKSVTDEDVARAINVLREQRVDYKPVSRPLQQGDVAVVNYSGTSEGKPLTELTTAAGGLTERKEFWIELGSDAFIPGFAEQLSGATSGERRTVKVTFPSDFMIAELGGKEAVYDVEVVEAREKVLPELNDDFARALEAENFERLREGVRGDLENELRFSRIRNARNQVIRGLLDRATFDLPESAVANETRNVIYDIVRENQQRGISNEVIDQQKDAIFNAANSTARERVKAAFLFRRIAEKEGIRVEKDEVLRRIGQLAASYQMPADQFFKELQKRNGIPEIYDQLQTEKVIAFLIDHARVEEVAPSPGPA